MKVAIVAQPFDAVLPPNQNSIGIIAFNTAVQLAQRAEVTVYLPGPQDDEQPPPDTGIEWVWVPTGLGQPLQRLARRLKLAQPSVRSAWFHAPYIWRIASRIRRARHDVVHVFNFPQFARWTGLWSAPGTAVSLEMQCDWLSQWPGESVRPGLNQCDMVWGVSSHVTDLIRGAFPDLQARLDTVYNGFDTERFTPAPVQAKGDGEFRILFVGRVSPEKGVHLLIEAMGQLVPEFPKLRLRLVGPRTQLAHELIVGASEDPLVRSLDRFYGGEDGPDYQAYLDRRIAELGLQAHVSFAGNVPQSELRSEYAAADLLANPSYSESFGMSLVEAMAVGRPVVASRVGGMKDIVETGRSGMLFPCGDAAALEESLRRVISDEPFRLQLAEAGRCRALEKFSWGARAERLWAGFTATHGHG